MSDSSVSTSGLKLDDLINDVHHFYLFKYLDLAEIFNLKLVSKKFYSIVNSFQISELSFTNEFGDKGNWPSTTRPIKLKHQLRLTKFSSLTDKIPNNFINLKRLKITILNRKDFFLARIELNEFKKLQILEFGGVENLILSDYHLNLPDLKVLSIGFLLNLSSDDYDDCGTWVVNAPNLHTIHVYGYKYIRYEIDQMIEIKHPLSIKCLKLSKYEDFAEKFTNLECLGLEIDKTLSKREVDHLLKFKNLKSLKMIDLKKNDSKDLNELKNLFTAKKNDLEVVLNGVKIKKIDKIDEYIRRENDLAFQLQNYSDLDDNLDFIKKVDYKDLVPLLSDPPTGLFRKYNNIQKIGIEKCIVADEDHLINFIDGCLNLSSLIIVESSLSQEFFDRLPEISSLSNLTIIKSNLKLNFKFIMKLPYISNIKTDQHLAISYDLNLNDLKYLENLEFTIHGEDMQIEKKAKDRYLFWNSETLEELEIFQEEYDYGDDLEGVEDLESIRIYQAMQRFQSSLDEYEQGMHIDFDRLVKSINSFVGSDSVMLTDSSFEDSETDTNSNVDGADNDDVN